MIPRIYFRPMRPGFVEMLPTLLGNPGALWAFILNPDRHFLYVQHDKRIERTAIKVWLNSGKHVEIASDFGGPEPQPKADRYLRARPDPPVQEPR